MGTHGRSGLSRALLGSVAQAVVHRSTVPLLLVHGSHRPAVSPSDPFHAVLLPLDGTPLAEGALTYQLRAHLATDSRLVLLRAVSHGKARDTAEDRPAMALGYLDALVQERLQGRKCQTLVWGDEPAEAILETASLEHVDLIVMASHRRSRLDRLLYGSIAEHVLRHASMPVLLVPPSEADPAGIPAAAAVAPAQ